MRSVTITVIPPVSDKHLSFLEAGEDFAIEKFVSKLAVKRLDVAVLPGATRLDEKRFDIKSFEPTLNNLGTEFGAVI